MTDKVQNEFVAQNYQNHSKHITAVIMKNPPIDSSKVNGIMIDYPKSASYKSKNFIHKVLFSNKSSDWAG
jgi:hypothetical protein